MFSTFLEFYVRAFATLLPVLAVIAVAIAAQRAKLSLRKTAIALSVLGIVLGLWYALAARAGELGLLMPPQTPTGIPYVLIFLFGGAGLLVLLGSATHAGRRIAESADQREMIAFQVPRVMGFVFLVGWAFGEIPWQFALPAGVGDIWVGIAGWQAFKALEQGRANANALVWRANIIGLADFAIAVLTGVLTSEGFLHVMALEEPNIINNFPLVLFPAFFVPIFLAAHIFSILQLRRAARHKTVTA
ncbi:membrane protease YdiL (CAAX protease family) [Labrenzia sp. EL_142]|nr:membrane protease YdiL (CAAX protease family) [Labrenzia sp. EL_142]